MLRPPEVYELPAKTVFTINPATYNMTSTTDLDTTMLRFLLSWGAASSDFAIASLDVPAAFLNAPGPNVELSYSVRQLCSTNSNVFLLAMYG